MKVSKKGIDFIKSFEGFSSTPYYDCVGVKTLGYGMTGEEIEGLNYVSEVQATRLLENILKKYSNPIDSELKKNNIKLNQSQFNALVSMSYNVGVQGVLNSTLMKLIKNGNRDRAKITEAFLMWNKGTIEGELVPITGLTRRRKEEAEMFFSDYKELTFLERLNAECNKQGFKTFPQCRIGAKGNITKIIQEMLLNIGYPVGTCGADGIFGVGTERAVKAIQRDCNIESDGIVGKRTWDILFRSVNQ